MAEDRQVLGSNTADLPEDVSNEVAFSWQASEYVHHHKGFGWYAALVAVLVALSVVAALLHFWLSIGAFVAMGVAAILYAHRPPRTLLYELTSRGVKIDGRQLDFGRFRSFSVLPDQEWHTIDLEPARRFDPRMSLLFSDEDLEPIVEHLEQYLPRVDRRPDAVELLSRYLRF